MMLSTIASKHIEQCTKEKKLTEETLNSLNESENEDEHCVDEIVAKIRDPNEAIRIIE